MTDDDFRERIVRNEMHAAALEKRLEAMERQLAEARTWGFRTMLAIFGSIVMAYWDRIKAVIVIGEKGP